MARTRIRSEVAAQGHMYGRLFGSIITDDRDIIVTNVSRCEDALGFGDHPLEINHRKWKISSMSGENIVPGNVEQILSDCPPPYYTADFSHLPLPDLPSVASMGTTTLARTNPSRPAFALPAFIGELKDFPRLFKSAGDTLIEKGANAFLSYQFGWKPLISDMKKALDFSATTRKRVDEWTRLHSNGGLKRRISLGSDRAKVNNGFKTAHSGCGTLTVRENAHTTRNAWATVRWLPDEGSMPPSTTADYEKYSRALLGAGVGGLIEGAWQLMPWSWMADWFGNVGEYLGASNNTVGANAGVVNIMATTETNYVFERVSASPWLKGGDAVCTLQKKQRFQSSGPSLSASLPFLSGKQLSILGALAIQRVPRSLL